MAIVKAHAMKIMNACTKWIMFFVLPKLPPDSRGTRMFEVFWRLQGRDQPFGRSRGIRVKVARNGRLTEASTRKNVGQKVKGDLGRLGSKSMSGKRAVFLGCDVSLQWGGLNSPNRLNGRSQAGKQTPDKLNNRGLLVRIQLNEGVQCFDCSIVK